MEVWAASEDIVGLLHALCTSSAAWATVDGAASIALATIGQHLGTLIYDVRLRQTVVDLVAQLSTSPHAATRQRALSVAFSLAQLCPKLGMVAAVQAYAKTIVPKAPVKLASRGGGGAASRPLSQRQEVAAQCAVPADAVALASETVLAVLAGGVADAIAADTALIRDLCQRFTPVAGAVVAQLLATDMATAPGLVAALVSSQCLSVDEAFAGVILPRLNTAAAKQRKDESDAYGQVTVDMIEAVARAVQAAGRVAVAGEATHAAAMAVLRWSAGVYPGAVMALVSKAFLFSPAAVHRAVVGVQGKRTSVLFARARQLITGGVYTAVVGVDKDSVRQTFNDVLSHGSVGAAPRCATATCLALLECGEHLNKTAQDELVRAVLSRVIVCGSNANQLPSSTVNALISKATGQIQWGIVIKERIIEMLLQFLRGKVDTLWPGEPDVSKWWESTWSTLLARGLNGQAAAGVRRGGPVEGDGAPAAAHGEALQAGVSILAPLLHQCLAGQNPALNTRIADSLYGMLTELADVLGGWCRGRPPSTADTRGPTPIFAAAHLRTALLIAVLPTVATSGKTARFVPLLLALASSANAIVVVGDAQAVRDDLLTLIVDALFLLHTDAPDDPTLGQTEVEVLLWPMEQPLRLRCDRTLPGALDRWHVVDLATWTQSVALKTLVCAVSAGETACERNCLQRQLPIAEQPRSVNGGSGSPVPAVALPPIVTLEPVQFPRSGAAAPPHRGSTDVAGVAIDWAWFGATRRQRSKDVYLEHFHRSRILRANDEALGSSPRKKLRTDDDL